MRRWRRERRGKGRREPVRLASNCAASDDTNVLSPMRPRRERGCTAHPHLHCRDGHQYPIESLHRCVHLCEVGVRFRLRTRPKGERPDGGGSLDCFPPPLEQPATRTTTATTSVPRFASITPVNRSVSLLRRLVLSCCNTAVRHRRQGRSSRWYGVAPRRQPLGFDPRR